MADRCVEERRLDWPCGCWIESSGEWGACAVHKSNFMWCDRLAELAARYRHPEPMALTGKVELL